jgi:hypothetical protein
MLGTIPKEPVLAEPRTRRPNYLFFAIRSAARVGVDVRPIGNIRADTSQTDLSIIDEFMNSPAGVPYFPEDWYRRAATTLPDTGRAIYRIVWVAYETPELPPKAAVARPTARVIGQILVDPARNRIIWTKGGRHAP